MGNPRHGNAWAWNDPEAPPFHEDSYQVAKSALFQSPAQPRPDEDVSFILLELHVLPDDEDSSTEESGSRPGDLPACTADGTCRVFIHTGNLSEMQDENSGTKECYYAPSSDEALLIYAQHYAEFSKLHKSKKFLSRWIGSPVYRKQALEKGISEGPAISDEVTRLVEYLWREAMGELREILSVPYRKIGIGKVEKAEGILLSIRKLLDGEECADCIEVDDLSDQFYKLIPHRPHHVCKLRTKRILAGKQELCQLIHDIVKVSEATDWSQRSSSQSRYRALQCYLECLEPNHPEYVSVESLVMSTLASKDPMKIKRIFAASRGVEEAIFARAIGNNRLLFHASRPANFLGILSRGVLLPKIVVEVFGGSRRDAGMLGSGIYFGDRVSTAQQYSSPSQQTGTRLMVVNKVALGNIKELHAFDLSLDEAPEGFHSTHGVSRTEDTPSEFKDDEYVVYDANQQCIRYLVEFTLEGDREIDMPLCETPVVEEGVEELIFCQEAQQESSALPTDIDMYDVECAKDPLAAIEAGLVCSNEQSDTVTLQAVHIRAKVLDLVAKVVVLQSYRNNSSTTMEAKYVFPVDEAAAVCGFEAFVNDKHVVGVVKEKEEAHRDYRTAVERGHGAYLMDEEAPNVFSVSIGNLPARCDVLIKVTYVTELTVEGDKLAFQLLGCVAPWKRQEIVAKGVPGGGEAVDVDLETICKEESVQVSVTMPTTITSIESPTHAIQVKQRGKQASIQLATDATLDEGMQLLIGTQDVHQPRMWLEEQPGEEEKAAMLVFYPDFDAAALPSPEMVLVLDMSNSMKGQVLDEARKLALLLLTSLPARCTFNVILFGTEFDELFPASQPKDKAGLSAAREFIQTATAVQGCSDFWRPLQSNHLLKPKSTLRNILLITDGHLSNEGATLRAVCRHRATSRVFTFGVSQTANRHLLAAVARAGGGAYEFFDSKAKSTWEKKAKRQMSRATQSAVTSISVNWEQHSQPEQTADHRGSPPLQAPAQITTLFRRNRLLVYGLVRDCQKATLCFEINGQRNELSLQPTEDQMTTGEVLHKLAARAVIRNWEEGALHADRTEHESQKSELKARIVQLSLKHSVVTAFTSFIAVEERDEEEQQQVVEGSLEAKAQSLSQLIAMEDVDCLPSLVWTKQPADLHQPSAFEQLSSYLQTARNAEDSLSFKTAEKYYEKALGVAKDTLSSSTKPLIQAAHSFSKFCVRVQNNMGKAYELLSSILDVEPVPEMPEETTVTEESDKLDDLDALQQALEWAETCQLGMKGEAATVKAKGTVAEDSQRGQRLASEDLEYFEAVETQWPQEDEMYYSIEPVSPVALSMSTLQVTDRLDAVECEMDERHEIIPQVLSLLTTESRPCEVFYQSVMEVCQTLSASVAAPEPLEFLEEERAPHSPKYLDMREDITVRLATERTEPLPRAVQLMDDHIEEDSASHYDDRVRSPWRVLSRGTDWSSMDQGSPPPPPPTLMDSSSPPPPPPTLMDPSSAQEDSSYELVEVGSMRVSPIPMARRLSPSPQPLLMDASSQDESEDECPYELVEVGSKKVNPTPMARRLSPPQPLVTNYSEREDMSSYELVEVGSKRISPTPMARRLSPSPQLLLMDSYSRDESEDECPYELVEVGSKRISPAPMARRLSPPPPCGLPVLSYECEPSPGDPGMHRRQDDVAQASDRVLADESVAQTLDARHLIRLQDRTGYWDFRPEIDGLFGIDIRVCKEELREVIEKVIEKQGAGTMTAQSVWDIATRFLATIVFSGELEKLILSQEGALPESEAQPLWHALRMAREYLDLAQPTLEDALGTGSARILHSITGRR